MVDNLSVFFLSEIAATTSHKGCNPCKEYNSLKIKKIERILTCFHLHDMHQLSFFASLPEQVENVLLKYTQFTL